MGFFDSLLKKKNLGKSDSKKNKIDVSLWEHIKCPYCFEEFSHSDVAFRSETGFSNEFISEKYMEYERTEDKESRAQLKALIDNITQYAIKQDKTYGAFWKKMVGDDSYENDEYCRMPVLTTEDATDQFYDEDGFLEAVRDKAGKKTSRRICPHCHNILPRFYGKYEIKFMSIVGITASGKTVYLSQLINNLEEDLDKVGCSVMFSPEATSFRKNHIVKKGYPLPAGTVVRFMPPLFFTLQGNKNITLVAYDIAGEACVDVENIATYGNFIQNSDGMLMLIDPGQFKGLHAALETQSGQVSEDEEKASPTAVLSAVHGAFMGGSNESSATPMAVVISKSDMLFDVTDASGECLIPYQSHIRQDVVPNVEKKFNYKDYQNVNADISMMVSNQFPALHTTIVKNFINYGYFAVSALGCDVEPMEGGAGSNWTPSTDPMPLRIEEPFCWLLKQWGVIG